MSPLFFAKRNVLLGQLSPENFTLMRPYLEHCLIAKWDILQRDGEALSHVHFPISGMCASIVAARREEDRVTGLIGFEGFVGLSLLQASPLPTEQIEVLTGGETLRVSVEDFSRLLEISIGLRDVIDNFADYYVLQVRQSDLTLRENTLSQRVARWILMFEDRVDATEKQVPLDFLSTMTKLSEADLAPTLRELAGHQLITIRNNGVLMVDRQGLVRWANGCYGKAEAEYQRLFPNSAIVTEGRNEDWC